MPAVAAQGHPTYRDLTRLPCVVLSYRNLRDLRDLSSRGPRAVHKNVSVCGSCNLILTPEIRVSGLGGTPRDREGEREGSNSGNPYRRTKMKKLSVNCQYSIALMARHGITALGQASESFGCLPTSQHHVRARVCTTVVVRRYDATTPQRRCALATAAVPQVLTCISATHKETGRVAQQPQKDCTDSQLPLAVCSDSPVARKRRHAHH